MAQRATLEQFISKAKRVHQEKYDYSLVEYKNNKTKVQIVCPEHGDFWQSPGNHVNSKQGCPLCNHKTRGGLSNHPLHSTWVKMNHRCNNPNNKDFKFYGGRGVKVSSNWSKDNPQGLKNFICDMYPTYVKGWELDKDILGDGLLYSKETCKWVSHEVNSQNRSGVKLAPEDVLEIKNLLKEGNLTQIEIAEMFSVNNRSISNIANGYTWKNVS